MEPHRRARKVIEREAVALSYRSELQDAPLLTAKGKGEVAERILELARIHNIPMWQRAQRVGRARRCKAVPAGAKISRNCVRNADTGLTCV